MVRRKLNRFPHEFRNPVFKATKCSLPRLKVNKVEFRKRCQRSSAVRIGENEGWLILWCMTMGVK